MAKHSSHYRKRKSETHQEFIERRFWSKVEKSDGCWLWKAGVRRKEEGYGQFHLNGRNVPAHRVALMLSGVILQERDIVAHHCDNPPCCNPAHLFVTTSAGNTADRHAKGRTASHERNGNAKLMDAEVTALRAEYAKGERVTRLAAKYGISRVHASRLVHNKMRAA